MGPIDLEPGRRLRIALLAAVVTLCAATPAGATVPADGSGFGVSDPDPIPSRSLGEQFSGLRPQLFRLIVDWNVVDDPGLKLQAAERIDRARAGGAREVIVAFGRPAAYVDPAAWLAKVGAFIDEFTPYVDWWSPLNEPNHRSGDEPNWMATTPHSGASTPPYGYGVDAAARYSSALASFLAARHPDDGLLSPDFHDDYDDDLGDGTPLATVSDGGQRVSASVDYIRHFREAGGDLGAALGWHPYSGVNRRDLTSTEDVAGAFPGLPIWVTEIGAAGSIPGGRFTELGERYQLDTVEWMVGALATHPRVERLLYWHMVDHNPVWDTALVRADGSRRPAWYTWCAAAHAGRAADPDCDAGGIWQAWRSPGGLITSQPAVVSPSAGRLSLFARGADGALWERRHDGAGWSEWESLGGAISSEPAAESPGDGTIRVSARGADGAQWEKGFDGQSWSAWAPAG